MPTSHRRRSLQVALLATTTGAAAAGAELVWRALVRARHAADRQAFAEPLFRLVDGDALYELRPGADVEHTIPDPAGGPATVVRYHVGEDGLRVHPSWPPPPATTHPRVLFLGDSYTFGTAVADGVSFPHQVEPLLAAAGVPACAVNAGVPGHNSEQELARLPALLQQFTPRVVVLAFVVNDAEPPTYAPLPPERLHARSWSWLAAAGHGLWHRLTSALVDDRPLWPAPQPEYEYRYERHWTPGHPIGAASLAAVRHMHELCRAHAAQFVVATLPDFTRAFDDTYPYGGIHAQVCAAATAAGARAIDLGPPLRGAAAANLRVPGDGHPDANGHRRLAELLAPLLAEVLRG